MAAAPCVPAVRLATGGEVSSTFHPAPICLVWIVYMGGTRMTPPPAARPMIWEFVMRDVSLAQRRHSKVGPRVDWSGRTMRNNPSVGVTYVSNALRASDMSTIIIYIDLPGQRRHARGPGRAGRLVRPAPGGGVVRAPCVFVCAPCIFS
jgi:hypothetical protein